MTSELVWVLIRQDGGGNCYRVGRFATRAEAEQVVGILGAAAGGTGPAGEIVNGTSAGPVVASPDGRHYVIERVPPPHPAP